MFNFPGQRSGENILMVIRKHPIVYIKLMLVFLIIVVFPVGILAIVWLSYYNSPANQELGFMITLFASIYILFGLLITCIAWINEEFDLFIITNERLIDITQVTFFKRTVSSTPLEQIQDTTSDIGGFLPTIFNYGHLIVQTAAGDASDFFIDRVPDPVVKARIILNWAHERRQNGNIDID